MTVDPSPLRKVRLVYRGGDSSTEGETSLRTEGVTHLQTEGEICLRTEGVSHLRRGRLRGRLGTEDGRQGTDT
jgi:hypothetical protein